MTANRKPHSTLAGYVCELKCRLGGHVVVLDREHGAGDIDADTRWIVMHLPSSLHVAVHSQAQARDVMKGVARATSIDDACRFADILPRPAEDADAVDEQQPARAGGVDPIDGLTDRERDQLIDRFMADPENEPSDEGRAALNRLFAFDYSKRRKS